MPFLNGASGDSHNPGDRDMKFGEMRSDRTLEEGGTWAALPGFGTFEVKISRATSKRARDAYRKYVLPHERKIATGAMSDEDASPMMALYVAHGLLHDWRGGEDDDGNPVPFSVETAIALLSIPEMKDLRGAIQEAAGDRDL